MYGWRKCKFTISVLIWQRMRIKFVCDIVAISPSPPPPPLNSHTCDYRMESDSIFLLKIRPTTRISVDIHFHPTFWWMSTHYPFPGFPFIHACRMHLFPPFHRTQHLHIWCSLTLPFFVETERTYAHFNAFLLWKVSLLFCLTWSGGQSCWRVRCTMVSIEWLSVPKHRAIVTLERHERPDADEFRFSIQALVRIVCLQFFSVISFSCHRNQHVVFFGD